MDKSPDAFRTISEVAELLDTPAHVLRFWESRFPQIKPVKRAGGRRYYRPADMALLAGIRRLLHDEGLTIRGVQKILREQGVRHVSGLAEDDMADAVELDVIEDEGAEAPQASKEPIQLFPKARVAASIADAGQDAEDEPEDTAAHQEPVAGPAVSKNPEATAPEETEAEEPVPEEPEAQEEDDSIDEAALLAAITDPVEAPPKAAEPRLTDADPVKAAGGQEAPEPAAEVARDEPAKDESQGMGRQKDAVMADAEGPTFDLAPEDTSDTDEAGDNIFVAQHDESPTADDVKRVSEPAAADAPQDMPAPPPKGAMPAAAPPVDLPRQPLPALPVTTVPEIAGHWLPADLRRLRAGAFGDNAPQAVALFQRLVALRNRVGDLGRVPRR